MLFSVFAVTQAAVALGWPCQRLNWAWRNVWTTCGIQSYVPSSAAPAGSISSGFATLNTVVPGGVGFQLDGTGAFNPGGNAPYLCSTGPTSGIAGGTMMRNRCRRMLDTYGNLVFLCKTPAKGLPPGNGAPNIVGSDYYPQSTHQPHANNALNLAFLAQACLTPGTAFPTPQTTCPGLMGWFTVVWNACSFSLAPGWSSNTPSFTPLSSPSAGLGFSAPTNLCGASPTLSTPSTATSPAQWNTKGTAFRSTRCRRALDQFGRTASRCGTAPSATGYFDVLRGLANTLAGIAPWCGTST